MGRRLTVTADHPLVAATAPTGRPSVVLAGDVTTDDWLPIALGDPLALGGRSLRIVAARCHRAAGLGSARRDRPARRRATGAGQDRRCGAAGESAVRLPSIRNAASLRGGAPPACRRGTRCWGRRRTARTSRWTSRSTRTCGRSSACSSPRVTSRRTDAGPGSAGRSTRPPRTTSSPRSPIGWRALGVKVTVRRLATTMQVSISSRLLAAWFEHVLGLPVARRTRTAIPDLAWTATEDQRRALLRGLWTGDGSWSPSPAGHRSSSSTARSRASWPTAWSACSARSASSLASRSAGRRRARSTPTGSSCPAPIRSRRRSGCSSRTSGRVVLASIGRQSKRIAPTGYGLDGKGTAWVRVVDVTRSASDEVVYSAEVAGTTRSSRRSGSSPTTASPRIRGRC